VSDIDTVVVDSLKALDLEWPIREADIVDALWHFRKVPKLVIAEIAAKQSWNCVRAWTGRP
jgi:hypothetical protein